MPRSLYALLLIVLLGYLAYENLSGSSSRPTATIVSSQPAVLSAARFDSIPARSSSTVSSSIASSSSSSSSTASSISSASSSSTTVTAVVPATSILFPPPPPACTSLSCTGRFTKAEPDYADLTFQPGIDWHAGGIRGDCVAGELEYIMPKYCSPYKHKRKGKWPSEERLNDIDVHVKGKPMAMLKEVIELMPNATFLFMGDSVMEQFYNTVQCFLQKEGIGLPNDDDFLRWIQTTAPLWRMGKRKKPPKLPQRAVGGTRLLYARVTTYQQDEIEAAVKTADVIILNWGLHYQKMDQYRTELSAAFDILDKHASLPGHAVLFSETGAQHFKSSDPRGYTTGEWEHRDKTADKQCNCAPIEDFNVNVRNRVLAEVLGTGKYKNVGVLPFYELTRPRWRWHFGNCTKRPNGWNYWTCCDCTHFCFSPAMWHSHLHSVKTALLGTPGIGALRGIAG